MLKGHQRCLKADGQQSGIASGFNVLGNSNRRYEYPNSGYQHHFPHLLLQPLAVATALWLPVHLQAPYRQSLRVTQLKQQLARPVL